MKQSKDYYSWSSMHFCESGRNHRERPRAAARNALANQPTACEPGDRAAVVNYVANLSADLATMARRSGLQTLGVLIKTLRLEAKNASNYENGALINAPPRRAFAKTQ
jgi:hypothetical protein